MKLDARTRPRDPMAMRVIPIDVATGKSINSAVAVDTDEGWIELHQVERQGDKVIVLKTEKLADGTRKIIPPTRHYDIAYDLLDRVTGEIIAQVRPQSFGQ